MIPKLKLVYFSIFLLLLILVGCKDDPAAVETDIVVSENSDMSDSLFGELNEKQQYYQHLVLEIAPGFQQNIDSLAEWVIENEPGGIRFVDWEADSISRFKIKLDSLPIIQPLYYVDYFEYLNLPQYQYWKASTHNRDSVLTQVFNNDRIGLVGMGKGCQNGAEFDEWTEHWKKQTNVNIVRASFEDRYTKRDYQSFLSCIRNSKDVIQLDLTRFDTVALNNYRVTENFQGLFLVEAKKDVVNKQIQGGCDLIFIKLENQIHKSIPFESWSLNVDNRQAFEESTKRILSVKSRLAATSIVKGVNEQKTAVQSNLLYGSVALLNNDSKQIPFKPGVSIYSDEKINVNRKVKLENKFKIYQKNISENFDKITEGNDIKLIVLNDSVSDDLLQNISSLSVDDNVYICFSNSSFYKSIFSTPNLIYCPKNIEGEIDYSILLQQCTGQLAFKADFVSEDSIVTGIKTKKIKLARTDPSFCLLSGDTLQQIDYAVKGAMGGRAFPGCQVLIAKDGCIIYDKSFGHHTYDRVKNVTDESLYDLASLTKVVSTTLVGMKLYEMEAYGLNDSLREYLPDSLKDHLRFPNTIRNVTFQELFTHKSGMPAGFPIIKYMRYTNDEIGRFDQYFCDRPDSIYATEVAENFFLDVIYQDSMWLKLNQIWLDPNKPYKYSDVNMNTLYFLFKSIIHNDPRKYGYKVNDRELKERNLYKEFLYDKFYTALGMERTKYKPLQHFSKIEIVPTENERFWRKQLLHGHVHDPNAALYGGIAGNAGIFSTTNDLAILGEMLLNKGSYNGTQFLKPETVAKFTSVQPGSHRGLGFNKPSLNTSAFGCAYSAPLETYGHTGFTGTCIWVDPVNKLTYIFLSNRVNPTVNNRIYQYGIRRRVHQFAYDAQLFK